MVGRADGAVSRTQQRGRRGDLGLGYPVDQAALGPDMRRRLRSSAKDGREEQSDARGTRPGAAHGPFLLSSFVCRQPSLGFIVLSLSLSMSTQSIGSKSRARWRRPSVGRGKGRSYIGIWEMSSGGVVEGAWCCGACRRVGAGSNLDI